MRFPLVKEHGSWVVFILSSLLAILVAIRRHQVDSTMMIPLIFTIFGMILLVNSKKPLVAILKGGEGRKKNMYWFLTFSLCGIVMTIPFLYSGINYFFRFIPLFVLYLLLLTKRMEHALITELIAFSLLCIPAPVVYFLLTGVFSLKLYLIVFMFFSSGVFKVKVMLMKTNTYRVLMFFYCLALFLIFGYLGVSIIVLLPLIDNLLASLRKRVERLKVTGQIELAKAVIFTVLFILFGYNAV